MIRRVTILFFVVYTVGLVILWIAGYRETPPLLRLDDRHLYATVGDGHLIIVEDIPPVDWRYTDFSKLPDDGISGWLTDVVRYREELLRHAPGEGPIWCYHGNVASPHHDVFTVISLRLFALPPAGVFLGWVVVASRQALRRRHRRKSGECVSCGHDLAGLSELNCPECGGAYTRHRLRLRRRAKWVGLALCVLIVFGSVASLYGHVTYLGSSGKWGNWMLSFGACGVVVYFNPEWGLPPRSLGWHCGETPTGSPRWIPEVERDEPAPGAFVVVVPFWVFLLAAGLPTAWLWWRDRRPPKGHCRTCGYDLTGNTTGRCPECGCATRPEKGG